MRNVRLVARLDVKQSHLIKGVHLEGWRKVGDPAVYAKKYYAAGADELLYMDVVASLYGRNNLTEIVSRAARDVFLPICVGGGIRSVEDADRLLRAGADKVAVNTAAVARPALLSELASRFGSQAVVLSVEAKRTQGSGWEALTDNGREHTGRDAIEWIGQAAAHGAGEILVTSVDRDGTAKGMDLDLLRAVTAATPLPVIASGGVGEAGHAVAALHSGEPDAVASARALHYGEMNVEELRSALLSDGWPMPRRTMPAAADAEERG